VLGAEIQDPQESVLVHDTGQRQIDQDRAEGDRQQEQGSNPFAMAR